MSNQSKKRAETAVKILAKDNLELLELLRECERVLAMVPATHEPVPGFLGELQRSYVAPLIIKIRDQFI